jgi:hypothetical protein
MIEDLPDVDELVDNHQPYGHGNPDEKMQKFIRPIHRISPDAGMAPYGGPPKPSIEIPIQEVNVMNHHPPMLMPSTINCIDISNHIQNCPICSRFYKNDTTVHIVIIVILGLICILLLKRVLNV